MKINNETVSLNTARIAVGLLTTAALWGQTGKVQSFPDILLTNSNTTATTAAVSATGQGNVLFTMGKPIANPHGACVRVNAEILRNETPANSQQLIICNSEQKTIQVNNAPQGQYKLRLTKQDSWNTVPVNFTLMKANYPSGAQRLSLVFTSAITVAPGTVERELEVPGPGSLSIRMKWIGTGQVNARLRDPNGGLSQPASSSRGSLTLNAGAATAGMYKLVLENPAQSGNAIIVTVDQIDFLPN